MANMWEGWEGMSQSLEADSATKLNKQKADSYNKETQGRALFGQVIQRLKPGPDGTYDMKAIVQGLQQAGAGQDPQLIASALAEAMPFMNAQSQMAFKQWQQQLGWNKLGVSEDRAAEQARADKAREEQQQQNEIGRNDRARDALQQRRDAMVQKDQEFHDRQFQLLQTAQETHDLAKKRLIMSEMRMNQAAHSNFIKNNIQAGSSLMATPAEKQQWMEENKAYIKQADEEYLQVQKLINDGGPTGGATPGNTPTSTPPSGGDPNNGAKWTTPPPVGGVPPVAPLPPAGGSGVPAGPVPPAPGGTAPQPTPPGGGSPPAGAGLPPQPPPSNVPPQAGGRPLDPKLQADFKEAVGLGYPAAPIIQHFKSQGFDVSGLGG